MNLQTIIEKTLNEALPGMIQSRVNASLESAINPAIDAAIASALSNVLGNPAPVKAVPVAKPSSQVRVKAPTTPKAKPAKAKAKPVAPAADHGALFRATRVTKANREWLQLDSCPIDIACRENVKRKNRYCRVTPIEGDFSEYDAERLQMYGFRIRVEKTGTRIALGPQSAYEMLQSVYGRMINRY